MSYPMIGIETIEIDWKSFVSGMSSSNFTVDGGFSPGNPGYSATRTNINPIAVPGLLYPPGPLTDKSTNLTGQMICSCEDPLGNVARLFVSTDTDQDGRFFTYNNGLTEVGAEDTLGDYRYGVSDMVAFDDDEVYITNTENIVRWERSTNTFTYNFYAFTFDDGEPHPALLYENNVFYGDGNLLLRQTTGGGTPTAILTLPANQIIVSLGVDPGTGSMLISIVEQLNLSGTVNSLARVGYYNGFSNKLSKVVFVDEMVLAFYPVGGTVYITYGQKLGYWTGAGIQFLRTLNVPLEFDYLPYKHHITNIGQTLYIVERGYILAYGEIIAGAGKAFYYAVHHPDDSGSTKIFTLVVNIGSNKLAVSFASNSLYTFDITDVSAVQTGGAFLRTNKYELERLATFTQAIVSFGATIPTGDNIGTLSFIDDSGNLTTIATLNTTSTEKNMEIQGTSATFSFQSIETRSFQLLWSVSPGVSTNVCPIERITIFYNPKA